MRRLRLWLALVAAIAPALASAQMLRPVLRPRSGFSTALSPALWTPALLGSGLLVNVDATDAATLTFNGSNVAAWVNKGAFGGTFTQATASSQPTYSATSLNGRPAVSSGGGTVSLGQAGGLNSLIALSQLTGGSLILNVNNVNASIPVPADENHIVFLSWDVTGVLSGWVDGTQVAASGNTGSGQAGFVAYIGKYASSNAGGARLWDSNTAPLTLFNRSDGIRPSAGTYGLLLIGNFQPTIDQRQKVIGYMACPRQWNLQALLPAGDPYKSTCPTR